MLLGKLLREVYRCLAFMGVVRVTVAVEAEMQR